MTAEAGVFRRTPAFVGKARKLIAAGLSFAEVARRMNTSSPTIRKAIDCPASDQRASHLTHAQIAEIADLHSQGWSVKRIAAAVGCGRPKVRGVVEKISDGTLKQRVAAGAAHREGGAHSQAIASVLPPKITIRLTGYQQRLRDSFKARGMSHENATREALRVAAARAVEAGGSVSRAGGGGGVIASFHEATVPAGRGA